MLGLSILMGLELRQDTSGWEKLPFSERFWAQSSCPCSHQAPKHLEPYNHRHFSSILWWQLCALDMTSDASTSILFEAMRVLDPI